MRFQSGGNGVERQLVLMRYYIADLMPARARATKGTYPWSAILRAAYLLHMNEQREHYASEQWRGEQWRGERACERCRRGVNCLSRVSSASGLAAVRVRRGTQFVCF